MRLIGWALILLVPLLILAAAELLLRGIGLGDPVLYAAHPAYGYALQPNQRKERRHGAVITVDSRGLRTAVDWSRPADHHLLFIGDSVTYGGSYVDDAELFSERVCAGLAEAHGIAANCGNAGVNAYGVENMAARLAAEDYGADVIVAVILPGDALRGLRLPAGLPFHFEPLPPVIPATVEAVIFAWRYLHRQLDRLAAVATADQRPAGQSERRREVIDARLDRLLEVLRQRAEAGVRVLLVLTPSRAVAGGEADPVTEQVHARLAGSGLPYLDMRPHLRGQDLDAVYYDDVHLDPFGHALYGRVLTERIAALLRTE